MANIMVIEDDNSTRRLIEVILKSSGFNTILAKNGLEGLDLIDGNVIDLFLVDIMMPKMDGYEFTRTIREAGINTPIILLTAKSSISDKSKGFTLGVDDYMTKPFESEELVLRINAILKRANISHSHKIVINDVTLDYDGLTITRGKEVILLPKKEFYLLFKLLSYPNVIFTRFQLMDEIWGMDSETDEHTLNVHINRLRNRFKDYDEFEIQTIRGLGYKAVKK